MINWSVMVINRDLDVGRYQSYVPSEEGLK